MITKIIIGIISLAIVTTVIVVGKSHIGERSDGLASKNSDGEYVVELRENGFSPEEITISLNETVRFTNSTGKPFWPASDFHPIHTIYPEFDSKNPVPADQSWAFKFSETGKWRYHDHLAPYFTGIISVLNEEGRVVEPDCDDFSDDTPKAVMDSCWNEKLFSALESGGIKGAMDELQSLYNSDTAFIAHGCHRWAHVVGDMAFEKYGYKDKKVEKWDLPLETTYCGYGFFHGIFEHFFRENPDLDLARRICDHLTNTLGEDIPRIRQNCFHGVGHGFMPEPPPRKVWGEPFEMTTVALDACRQASPTDDPVEKTECMEGTFNVMADWMQQNKYGLSVNLEDPLGFCRAQEDRDVSLACFYEYAMRVTNYANDNIVKIANDYIKPTDDDQLATMIINSASASLLERHLTEPNYDHFVRQCHQIPERLRESCIFGLNGGLLAHGEPGVEYIKAIGLCDSKELSETEKDSCFKNLIMKFTWNYPKNKIAEEICPAVPARFKHYCTNES